MAVLVTVADSAAAAVLDALTSSLCFVLEGVTALVLVAVG